MKVKEAIDQLRRGDEIWVKMEIASFDFGTSEPVRGQTAKNMVWLNEDDEISLTEPKPELVEVPQFVADWFEENKDDLETAIWNYAYSVRSNEKNEFYYWMGTRDNKPLGVLIRMQDGYTVKEKPKYKIIKDGKSLTQLQFAKPKGASVIQAFWGTIGNPLIFDDKSKAEAVATLVEGTVEEV